LSIVAVGEEIKVTYDERDGLIAWYPFDKAVADRTGNIDPIDGESILPIITGKFGGAVKLDGDTFIAIPIDLGPDLVPSITISLWVKTDPRPADAELEAQLPNQLYIVSESIAVGNLKNDSTYFYGEALNHSIVGPKHTARRGQWQHVALVRTIEDRPNANGEIEPHVVAQFHSGGRISELVMPFRGQGMATDLYVGTNSPRHKRMFRGAVDELRIYDRALTEDEVKVLANAKAAGTGLSLPTGPATADVSSLDDVNFGELGGTADPGAPSTIATIPRTPPVMAPDDAIDETRNRLPTGPATADASSLGDVNFGELGGTADPLAELGAIDPLTEAAIPGNAPDPDSAEIIDRLQDADRVAQDADWRVKRIISVSPLQGVPGDLIEIRVELEKTDPLNQIPNVRVAGEGTQNYALATLNTTTDQPTATTEKLANWRIPQDFQVPGGTSRDANFLVNILDDANQPLQDGNLSNNAMRTTVRVFSPVVQVCGVLSFWDRRKYRSDKPGSRLGTASKDASMPLGGVEIDIWRVRGQCRDTEDGCSEQDDDKLDSTKSGLADGRFCTTTPRPVELYATTKLETSIAMIERDNGDQPLISSYLKTMPLHDVPQTLDWSASCPGEVRCSSRTGSGAANSQTVAWTNTLATLIDVERNYGGATVISPKISAWVSPDISSACSTNNNQARPDGKHICVITPYSNYRVAHEVGHIVMNRALDIYGASASKCPAGSGWATVDFEKCATTEGFANFFAAAIFWEQNAQNPFYQFTDRELEGATAQGNGGNSEACISNELPRTVRPGTVQGADPFGVTRSPHRIEGNAARFFWDLYDSTNESRGRLVDDTTVSLETLIDVWSEFDPGTSEREAEEGGRPGDNSNGRNAWDYVCRFPDARSELLLNCLFEQEGVVPLDGADDSCVY
jgi:hypothetical protein